MPTSVDATAERAPTQLRCTGQTIDYAAVNLVDGDPDTGWGASSTDGAGQSATVTFLGPVHVLSLGLTPGYARSGPRSDSGCAVVSAFDHNRFIGSVRYRFDDGSSVVADFADSPNMQFTDVDVVTRTVTVEILSTSRPPGADDDTILSDLLVEGTRP